MEEPLTIIVMFETRSHEMRNAKLQKLIKHMKSFCTPIEHEVRTSLIGFACVAQIPIQSHSCDDNVSLLTTIAAVEPSMLYINGVIGPHPTSQQQVALVTVPIKFFDTVLKNLPNSMILGSGT